MSQECSICEDKIGKKKHGLQCVGFCRLMYHAVCLKLSADQLAVLKQPGVHWKCEQCRARGAKKDNTEDATPASSTTIENKNVNKDDYNTLVNILRGVQDNLKSSRPEQTSLVSSVSFCTSKIEDFERKLDSWKDYTKKTDILIQENIAMNSKLSTIENKITDVEQFSR
ncbi:unnamed protein product [Phaedon cochleariae]|uniref:PHD-type domain-containing protein n=1 Tax=Phaedon cochleariae TaxID=80249 RepID=A0A9N9SJS9_PHACE|nr:unnamed protein product [Phaedon cochleariae]